MYTRAFVCVCVCVCVHRASILCLKTCTTHNVITQYQTLICGVNCAMIMLNWLCLNIRNSWKRMCVCVCFSVDCDYVLCVCCVVYENTETQKKGDKQHSHLTYKQTCKPFHTHIYTHTYKYIYTHIHLCAHTYIYIYRYSNIEFSNHPGKYMKYHVQVLETMLNKFFDEDIWVVHTQAHIHMLHTHTH